MESRQPLMSPVIGVPLLCCCCHLHFLLFLLSDNKTSMSVVHKYHADHKSLSRRRAADEIIIWKWTKTQVDSSGAERSPLTTFKMRKDREGEKVVKYKERKMQKMSGVLVKHDDIVLRSFFPLTNYGVNHFSHMKGTHTVRKYKPCNN